MAESMPLADTVSYPLWANILIFLAAGGVIWFSGVRLTHDLDALAGKTGTDRLFVGMLLLGGITSLPEVANIITASAAGNPALAVNNLLGSAAINVLLLAVADAFIGREAVTSINARPSTMMMANLCMLVLIATVAAIVIGDVAIFGVGVGSVAICAGSLFFFWLSVGHDARSSWTVSEDGEGKSEDAADDPDPAASVTRLVLRVMLNGVLLFAAGYSLSQTGDGIATQTGIASAFVGFALIGTATSLPELVTIVTALRIRRPEMAFGQVLGTNFVNLSLLPLGDLVFRGEPILNTLGDFEIVAGLLGATLIGIFMVGLLERRDRTIFKMGIDSAVVILLFGAGTALLSTL